MNNCVYCGKEFKENKYGPKNKVACSRECYWKWYYNEHREHYNKIRSEYHRKHYVPHPIKRKWNTEEERYQGKLDYSRNYYHSHKEECLEKNRVYCRDRYNTDEEFRNRRRECMKNYWKRRKEKQKSHEVNPG